MNGLVLALVLTADGGTIATRFEPPPGATREPSDGGVSAFLRQLPLLPHEAPVRLFDGTLKPRQDVHAAVVDLDVGAKDLQQCADATMRLWAEFKWARGQGDEVCFRATSGDPLAFRDWKTGLRPKAIGNRLRFSRTAAPDASRASFRKYLDLVFTYAGTASLARGLKRVPTTSVTAGDIFLQGGSPGHAVIVVDVAATADGRRLALLAQSYMPAQSIHVLKRPNSESPWYDLVPGSPLQTPEWTFPPDSAFRLESDCPRAPR